jgi:hypothetical protein
MGFSRAVVPAGAEVPAEPGTQVVEVTDLPGAISAAFAQTP